MKGGARFSSYFTWLVIAGLLLTVISGLLFGGGSLKNITTNAGSYVPRTWTDFSFIKAVFASMLAAFWAYEGWNSIGFLGGEIHNPNKNIPLALAGGMAIIIIAYLLVNFTYLYVLPVDQITEVYRTQNEIAGVSVSPAFCRKCRGNRSVGTDPYNHPGLHQQYDHYAAAHLPGYVKRQAVL